MRSILWTLKGPSVLPKTKQIRTVLFRTRFTTLWRSEIHINLKIDANALIQRRRHYCLPSTVCHLSRAMAVLWLLRMRVRHKVKIKSKMKQNIPSVLAPELVETPRTFCYAYLQIIYEQLCDVITYLLHPTCWYSRQMKLVSHALLPCCNVINTRFITETIAIPNLCLINYR
jgi:hypothetical protein